MRTLPSLAFRLLTILLLFQYRCESSTGERTGLPAPKASSGTVATFTDEDGDGVAVTLKGSGNMTVVLDDSDGDGQGSIESLVLDSTDAKSTLTIKVTRGPSGNGLVRIGEIKGVQGTEAMKSIAAVAAD